MKRSKLSKEKYKMYKIRAPRSGMEPNPVFKVINRLVKILVLNGVKRVGTSGQDSTQLRMKLVKRNQRKA